MPSRMFKAIYLTVSASPGFDPLAKTPGKSADGPGEGGLICTFLHQYIIYRLKKVWCSALGIMNWRHHSRAVAKSGHGPSLSKVSDLTWSTKYLCMPSVHEIEPIPDFLIIRLPTKHLLRQRSRAVRSESSMPNGPL